MLSIKDAFFVLFLPTSYSVTLLKPVAKRASQFFSQPIPLDTRRPRQTISIMYTKAKYTFFSAALNSANPVSYLYSDPLMSSKSKINFQDIYMYIQTYINKNDIVYIADKGIHSLLNTYI